MKMSGLITILLGVSLFITACTTSRQAGTPEATTEKPANNQPSVVKNARVMVEGREKAVTPATVQVRRSFGEYEVALVSGGETVRKFEIERAYTSEGSELEYSFFGDESGPVTEFDLSSLSRTKKGAYIIPYLGRPVQIQDREYGLTLLITN